MSKSGCSPTIRANKVCAGVLECRCVGNLYGCRLGGNYAGNVYDKNYLSPPILTMQGGGRQPSIVEYRNVYRIRKLTPRECGRLMGVSDEDISKMLEVNSNSQCYKQFGNSIVVPVMERMFETIFKRKD